MKKAILFAALSVLSLTACKRDQLTANGDTLTETRTPGDFNSLHISGANRVKVVPGTDLKVVVKGSANLLPYFKTTLTNKQLNLGFENANVRRDDIEVFITMPVLKGAALTGSGNLDMDGSFPATDELNLAITGSGNINLNEPLAVALLKARITGSGKMFLQKATVKVADVDISGSGDVHLHVSEVLKARISGSGDIYYQGNPNLDTRITGSGKLVRN